MAAPAWVRKLGLLIWQRRRETGESLRTIAPKLDVSPSTLSRIERGTVEPDTQTLFRICAWLDVSVESVRGTLETATGLETQSLSTPDAIEVHLRADRDLPPAAAQVIAAMVRAAYQELSQRKE
jgi:transcriptional regulator with XRE-family HTH domain